MNTDQLTKFLAIARHGSMSKAASVLYITPSALSHSIQSLEEELGTQLFVRNKKGIVLTYDGELLYRCAEKIDRLSEEVINTIKNTSTITVGSSNSIASFILSKLPEDYSAKISLQHLRSKDLPEMLMKGAVDAIICDDYYVKQAFASGMLDKDDVDRVLIHRETLGLFVRKDSDLSKRKNIPYSEIREIPLCMQISRLSLLEWLQIINDNTGAHFNIRYNLDMYSYLNMRDKIQMPEIRDVNSISDLRQDPILVNYTFVKFADYYSSRYIYMWYLKSREKKVSVLRSSIADFYKSPPALIY